MAGALLAAFVVVPLVELYVILQVGHAIGVLPTIALLVVESALGAALVRMEGRRAWRAFRAALAAGTPPAREVADGVLVLVGGVLLLTPGFVTDVVGWFLLLPLTRPLVRRGLTTLVARRLGVPATVVRAARRTRSGPHPGGGTGRYVEGEVIRGDDLPDDRAR